MMNPEIKKEWLKRLRSGDYLQTRGRLRKGTGHCCMGVLCDILDPEVWTSLGSGDWDWDSWGIKIPVMMLDGIGILYSEQAYLLILNDGSKSETLKPQSFKTIAKHIEKML